MEPSDTASHEFHVQTEVRIAGADTDIRRLSPPYVVTLSRILPLVSQYLIHLTLLKKDQNPPIVRYSLVSKDAMESGLGLNESLYCFNT